MPIRPAPPPAQPPAQPHAPPDDQLVTSSDLVRHFGLWQERAARAPLYVLHRGRPRFVLTSIETMDALCAPHATDGGTDPARSDLRIDATVLLDGVSDLVLIADAEGAILASSRAARAHFGPLAAPGAMVSAISPGTTRPFLLDAIRRVVASGVGDRLEVPSAAREDRILSVAIEPSRRGVALIAQDGTTARDHASARAAERALDAAMLAATGVAGAAINPRGYIAAPTAALAALTGLAPAALAMIRFVALAEIGARVALGQAIERAMSGETPPPLIASLLVNRADPVPVRIGLAPSRSGTSIDGVAALIVSL